jgi:DNA-directed RNA polymerase specialized sigma24 family protein
MDRDRTVTPANFDALLGWLDADRDRAGAKYEEIRSSLIRLFICRGSPNAEELADKTIDRVMHKLPAVVGSYAGDPALYFYGVSKNIYRESLRSPAPAVLPPPREEPVEDEAVQHRCLDKCMEHLPPETRALLLSYYEFTGQAKIDSRKQLAAALGIDTNALRLRVHRIRLRLEDCVRECVNGRRVDR